MCELELETITARAGSLDFLTYLRSSRWVMRPRTWTVAQASALIPWLTEVFTAVRTDVDELLARRARAQDRRGMAANGLNVDVSDDRIQELERRIQDLVAEVGAFGLEVRRVDGMVDIPSWRKGELVYLCWRLGEPRITHWHPVHGGWQDRRCLPLGEVEFAAELN